MIKDCRKKKAAERNEGSSSGNGSGSGYSGPRRGQKQRKVHAVDREDEGSDYEDDQDEDGQDQDGGFHPFIGSVHLN